MSSTKDLAAYATGTPFSEAMLVGQPENTGLLTGPKKVAQKFLMRLLTATGSMAYRPNEGCIFAEQIAHGYISTETDLQQIFAMSLISIQDQMQADEDDDTEDDERFDTAILSGVVISAGSLVMVVTISTKAGTELDTIIPIDVTF